MTDFLLRDETDLDIAQERQRQNDKWGEQNHDPYTWLAILTEEVGEFAQRALHVQFGGGRLEPIDIVADKLRAELVQVCAVAKAMLECCDRGKAKGWR